MVSCMERPGCFLSGGDVYSCTGVGFPREHILFYAWTSPYPHQWFFLKGRCKYFLKQSYTLTKRWDLNFIEDSGWAQEEDTKDLYTVEPVNLITRNAPR